MRALFCAFHKGDRLLRLSEDFGEIEWLVAHSPAEVAAKIRDVDLLILNNRICGPDLGVAIRDNMTARLKWIHFVTSGVEMGLAMGLPRDVPVSSAAGTNGPVLAEHAVTLLLATMRRFADIHRGQSAHEWRRREISEAIRSLEGARVCVLGLGAVGREVARKVRAFDADVIATAPIQMFRACILVKISTKRSRFQTRWLFAPTRIPLRGGSSARVNSPR